MEDLIFIIAKLVALNLIAPFIGVAVGYLLAQIFLYFYRLFFPKEKAYAASATSSKLPTNPGS